MRLVLYSMHTEATRPFWYLPHPNMERLEVTVVSWACTHVHIHACVRTCLSWVTGCLTDRRVCISAGVALYACTVRNIHACVYRNATKIRDKEYNYTLVTLSQTQPLGGQTLTKDTGSGMLLCRACASMYTFIYTYMQCNDDTHTRTPHACTQAHTEKNLHTPVQRDR